MARLGDEYAPIGSDLSYVWGRSCSDMTAACKSAKQSDTEPFSHNCSVGGVLTLASFQRDFGYGKQNQTRTNSLSVGLQQLGAFLGCFLAWPIAERYGRKKPLVLFSVIFCIGGVMQTINTGSLVAFYAARIVSGLGLGASTVVVPMFSSEMAPTELRGQIGSFFQLFFTLVGQSHPLLGDGLTLAGDFHILLD